MLVPISPKLQPLALLELRTRLCFLRESSDASGDLHARRSSAAAGERWMHELGVAFVQRDKHGRGFLWTVNRLLPSQAGRSHSEKLLGQFREICERLEMDGAEEDQLAMASGAINPPSGDAEDLWDWGGPAGPYTRSRRQRLSNE